MSVAAAPDRDVRSTPGVSFWRWPLLILAAVLIVASLYLAYGFLTRPATANAETAFDSIAAPDTPVTQNWGDALSDVNASIEARTIRADRANDDWAAQTSLAAAYIERGQLTGNYEDYAEANRLLARASGLARQGAGPHLESAGFALKMHRLKRAATQLNFTNDYVIPPGAEGRAAISAMRGDIALYSGDYDRAGRYFSEAQQLAPGTATDFRRFEFARLTGDPATAPSFNAMARAAGTPRDRRFLAVTRGTTALARGDWEQAKHSFDIADQWFPGDWRTQALQAQMLSLTGDMPGAIAMYERIAEDHQSPEAMDALAAIYRYQGNRAASQRWAVRAERIWNRRIELVPEAAYNHAAEHQLTFGDPRRALALARADFQARPFGGSAIGLAWALIANGEIGAARRLTEPVIASAYDTPELHAVAAQIYALSGESDKAERHRRSALARNPMILDDRTSLIWFH